MRLTLVQPPNGLHDYSDLAPPLGLLTLAAAVEEDGVDVSLLDMNLQGMRDHEWVQDDFYAKAEKSIIKTNPDVVGFTSMAVESHVCLELARRIKAEDPGVVIVLGGPHFSAIAQEVLELYPWVDYVVTGEGEMATRYLLRYLRGKASSSDLVNVAYRTEGNIVLKRIQKSLKTLESLPPPAYHLVDLPLYFETNPMRLLDYEHGRGCIFRCSFCYSPVHWGQGEQVKEVQRVVEEVSHLYELGARHLFFVQDNFPNSKEVAKAICNALAEVHTGITWNCYGTLPQLTDDLLDNLSTAGCNSVFVGVDAISESSKRAFAKHFFKGWAKLEERLKACLDRGIVPTCAFMIDFPEKSHAGTDAALNTALFARNLGCGIRLNTLTLYNQTASALEMSTRPKTYTNLKPRLLLDTPDVIHDNPFAQEHPELFPFHHTFLPLPLYEKFVAAIHMAYTLFTSFPRTLLQYVLVDNGSLWGLLEHLAERLGDLTQFRTVMRRPIERELFLQEFPRLLLSQETHSAFAMETAELSLSRDDLKETVLVRVEDQVQSYLTGQYKVINLPHDPGTFDKVKPLPKPQSTPKPYLLLRQGNQINYFELDEEVVRPLDEISTARRSRELVQVPSGLFSELLGIGVLQTPDKPGGKEREENDNAL